MSNCSSATVTRHGRTDTEHLKSFGGEVYDLAFPTPKTQEHKFNIYFASSGISMLACRVMFQPIFTYILHTSASLHPLPRGLSTGEDAAFFLPATC